jgi:hypothetical protein
MGHNNGYRANGTFRSVHLNTGAQAGTLQGHIDTFNPATGLLGFLGHTVWDVAVGTVLQTLTPLGVPPGVLDPKCN